MTWSQYARARLLLAEEQVGAALRAQKELEEAERKRTVKAIREDEGL